MSPEAQAAYDEWKRIDAQYQADPTPERERATLAAFYRFHHLNVQEEPQREDQA